MNNGVGYGSARKGSGSSPDDSTITAKSIRVAPVEAGAARRFVKRHHYSGTVVNNSQLHLGAFLRDRLHGVMQFGPPMKKDKVIPLVSGTAWNGMLELNRMVFDECLPRNSESRALGVALRMIRAHYPHIEWVISYADGTQCGDGTIYRAAGFLLTGIKQNVGVGRLADGRIVTRMTIGKGQHALANNGRATPRDDFQPLPGYMLRYIYFTNPAARDRLTVKPLPYSAIADAGARMYMGQALDADGSA